MTITYRNQIPSGLPPHTLDYEFDGERITAEHRTYHQDGSTKAVTRDTFDFTGLPDGRMDLASMETSLPIMPIRAAERTGGVLHVTLLRWTRED